MHSSTLIADVENFLVEQCARLAHEANRVWCIGLGDESQVGWEDAPEDIQGSARAGARMHLEALFKGEDVPPSASHDAWMEYKVADGWVYGEVKDAGAKTHPCIVPYQDLPRVQREKDHLFGEMVRQMLDATTMCWAHEISGMWGENRKTYPDLEGKHLKLFGSTGHGYPGPHVSRWFTENGVEYEVTKEGEVVVYDGRYD